MALQSLFKKQTSVDPSNQPRQTWGSLILYNHYIDLLLKSVCTTTTTSTTETKKEGCSCCSSFWRTTRMSSWLTHLGTVSLGFLLGFSQNLQQSASQMPSFAPVGDPLSSLKNKRKWTIIYGFLKSTRIYAVFFSLILASILKQSSKLQSWKTNALKMCCTTSSTTASPTILQI